MGTKRITQSKILNWKTVSGTTGLLAVSLLVYLNMIGAITITSYSDSYPCVGAIGDPCIANISFEANTDIFIYPGDEQWLQTSPPVKVLKLYRKWGKGYRKIDLDTPCRSTTCGASGSKATTKYSLVLRKGKTYEWQYRAIKDNPTDIIKWGFGFDSELMPDNYESDYVDPIWMPSGRIVKTIGINVTVEDYIKNYKTHYQIVDCNPANETCNEYLNGTYYKTIEYETKDQVLANITKCKPIGAVEIDGESYYYNEFYCSLFGDDNVPVCNGCNGDGTCETAKLCAEDNSELCFYPVSDELYTGGGFEGTPELKTLPQNLCEVTP